MSFLSNLFRRNSSLSVFSRLSDDQLEDIGLSRRDIVDAHSATNALELLSQRRNERIGFQIG